MYVYALAFILTFTKFKIKHMKAIKIIALFVFTLFGVVGFLLSMSYAVWTNMILYFNWPVPLPYHMTCDNCTMTLFFMMAICSYIIVILYGRLLLIELKSA